MRIGRRVCNGEASWETLFDFRNKADVATLFNSCSGGSSFDPDVCLFTVEKLIQMYQRSGMLCLF